MRSLSPRRRPILSGIGAMVRLREGYFVGTLAGSVRASARRIGA